jgi:hypothetical protein
MARISITTDGFAVLMVLFLAFLFLYGTFFDLLGGKLQRVRGYPRCASVSGQLGWNSVFVIGFTGTSH